MFKKQKELHNRKQTTNSKQVEKIRTKASKQANKITSYNKTGKSNALYLYSILLFSVIDVRLSFVQSWSACMGKKYVELRVVGVNVLFYVTSLNNVGERSSVETEENRP